MAMKKLEIIINQLHVERVIGLFDKHSITGFSLIEDVLGRGKTGFQDGDGLTDSFKNALFIAIVEGDKLEALAPELQDLLDRKGGVCWCTQVDWIHH